MASLHLTRVAFGASDLAIFTANIAGRSVAGEVRFTTRRCPRRAVELVGGHLHFIIKHTLVARVEILRFDDRGDGYTDIVCAADVQPVQPTARRAHQGWRYLESVDAPATLDAAGGVGDLPPHLLRALGALALI